MKYNSTLDLIGNTPLLLLANTSKKYKCNIYLKLEKYNLTQSIKDRAVKEMILSAIILDFSGKYCIIKLKKSS